MLRGKEKAERGAGVERTEGDDWLDISDYRYETLRTSSTFILIE